MTSHNSHIGYLPTILKRKGVEKVIISPGSRNAPLIQVFTQVFKGSCLSIVDERSAAYYGLGIAIKSQKPVVVISTSGTAALNFAPAIAEAYYQKIPLIVITADRPPEWIDMQDNQTIHQNEIYLKNIKKGFSIPANATIKDEVWYVQRIVNQLYNEATTGSPGPVHLNVPLREPLYNKIDIATNPRIISIEQNLSINLSETLTTQWEKANKIMLVAGQANKNNYLNEQLKQLLEDKRISILAEPTANIDIDNVISQLDSIKLINQKEHGEIAPDLVVYFGGQVVSKSLKGFLRDIDAEQWYISPDAEHVDTYQNLTTVIKSKPESFFKEILKLNPEKTTIDYHNLWVKLQTEFEGQLNDYVKQLPFCDMTLFGELTAQLTNKDVVFVGNSSVIRYFQLFKNKAKEIYANRGTSGIDGCLSTAAGVAYASGQKVICFLGDMSFLYDSNAIWNKNLPENLKIIVINNQGGNIFGMINGPETLESYDEYFLAHHPVKLEKLSEAYGLNYYKAESQDDVGAMYPDFYNSISASIMEVVIPRKFNKRIFSKFVYKLSSRHE